MTMKDTPEKKKAGGGEINLLDGKRSLNINIFLKQFRRWAILQSISINDICPPLSLIIYALLCYTRT